MIMQKIKKNILTVVFTLERGGTERSAQNFAIGFKEMGHDSRVLYTVKKGKNPLYRKKILNKYKIPVYYLKDNKQISVLKKWKPQIIHIHSHGVTFTDFNIVKRMYPNAKFVETNVFSIPSRWSNELDISFQLSKWCEFLYRKKIKDISKKTSVLPNPVICKNFIQNQKERNQNNIYIRKKYNIPLNAYVIGRIGQNDMGSWSFMIIDIFETLNNSGVRPFLILVDPPTKIITRIKKSKFKNQIIVLDKIYNDQFLKKIYSSMNLFLHISGSGESFGYTIVEAILSRTPVATLATPWCGNTQIEIVKNNICGFVVHKKKSFHLLIEKLLKGEIKYDSKLAVKSIVNRFNYKKVCKNFFNLIYNKNLKKFSKTQAINLMKSSFDRPSFIVMFMLKINMPFLIIRFASGYISLQETILTIFKNIIKKLNI